MSQDFNIFSIGNMLGLGLMVEHLTSGAEHFADILADARGFAFDASEVLPPLLHRANFFFGIPLRRLRHQSSHAVAQLDEESRFALLDFREHFIISRISAPDDSC